MTTSNIRLTDSQSAVISTIFNVNDPELAYIKVNVNEKYITALTTLNDYNLVKVEGNGVSVTDTGKRCMIFNGLLNEDETLTSIGEQFIINETITFSQYISQLNS